MNQSSNSEAGPANAGPVSTSDAPAAHSKFPAPIYRDTVLVQIFEDAKRFFLEPLLAIQYAHTLMLAKQGILTESEAAQCLRALDTLDALRPFDSRSQRCGWQPGRAFHCRISRQIF